MAETEPRAPHSESPSREEPATESRFAWLLWLNLLSLDAPIVAVTWQRFAGSVFDIEVRWVESLLLAIAIWAAYAGDRLLDGRRFKQSALSDRHSFARKHRSWLSLLLLIVLALGAWVGWRELDARTLFFAVSASGIVVLYLIATYFSPRATRSLLPRELVVGFLFAVGVMFFPQLRAPASQASWVLLAGALLALLFAANCLVVSRAEVSQDRSNDELSSATRWTVLNRSPDPQIMAVGVIVLAALWFLAGPLKNWHAAGSMGFVLLALVDRATCNLRIKPVLADLALLTPCIWLLREL